MQAGVKKALPGVACLLLLAGTIALLASPRTLTGDPNGPVPLALPDELGSWTGRDLLFCSSDQCGRSFLADELPPPAPEAGADAPRACPACGAALSPVAPGERNLLPASTPLFRRVYSRPGHPDLTATVVFSGMERRSIHRPQVCLVAQGNRITDEYTHRARTGPDETFPLRVLELSRPAADAPGGAVRSVYAYWLFNPERETDSHLARFAWMTVDNVVRSYRPRWGYASVAIPRDPLRPDAWKAELDAFLLRFHPLVDRCRADMDARRDRTVVVRGSSADANRYDGTGTTTSAPAAAGADAE